MKRMKPDMSPEQLREKCAPYFVHPKVIITTRVETLARTADYADTFLPMESENPARNKLENARAYYEELRISSFGNRLHDYMHALVALNLRRAFSAKVAQVEPLSLDAISALKGDSIPEFKAMKDALIAPGQRSESRNNKPPKDDPFQNSTVDGSLESLVALLVSASDAEGLQAAFIRSIQNTGEVWLFEQYREAFESISELKGLTNTPFEVKIVTEILQQLQQLRGGTDAAMKQRMMWLLEKGGDDALEVVWAMLSVWRRERSTGQADDDLKDVRMALEDTRVQDSSSAGAKALRELGELSVTIARKLVDQNIDLPESITRVAGTHKLEQTVRVDISARAIDILLRQVVRRQPIRRHRIYQLFVRAYLEREARRFTGQFASADVLLEGRAFAEHLAMKMTEENVSKISTKPSSVLFSTQGDWDSFLSTNDPLLVAASRAAPVQRGGTGLSFIHVSWRAVRFWVCSLLDCATLLHRKRYKNFCAPMV